MVARRFARRDLFAGSRFLAPLSEAALLAAGRAAGLREGLTLLELACGNGAVSLFFAEEFHLYARGLEAAPEFVECALDRAQRSPARQRVRIYHGEPEPVDRGGRVDIVCSTRGYDTGEEALLRPGGRVVFGRYRIDPERAPPEIVAAFPERAPPPAGEERWQRIATPLEWERYFAPQERNLRVYRRALGSEPPSPVALEAERRIRAFRAHSAHVSYVLSVFESA